ncbi:DUF7283 family protein [Haloarchaeobius sp. HRN-SO-5]|uniref:DUF7283 family protein n=1 Tax=Haloarchaeobius sp. HRN-SO-5 TaxID=3446118 RepID=UPI003EBF2715
MFDVPLDAWYCWLAVAVASVAVAGVAVDLPTRPAPDAPAAADTVDAVAGATYPTVAEHRLDADSVRLRPGELGLRSDGETSYATFAFGPVVPVADGTTLARVLAGVQPADAFDSPSDFRRAVRSARVDAEAADWRPAADRLVVRRVHWGDVRVTLVDA